MARRGRREQRFMSDINVTSLVDVMIVLLIMFMITAPMSQSGMDVRVPQTEGAPLSADEAIVVAETMTSLRVRRANRPLRSTPSSTSRPAALSRLPAGNTCLTSARPSTFSIRSGPSTPAISLAISSVSW